MMIRCCFLGVKHLDIVLLCKVFQNYFPVFHMNFFYMQCLYYFSNKAVHILAQYGCWYWSREKVSSVVDSDCLQEVVGVNIFAWCWREDGMNILWKREREIRLKAMCGLKLLDWKIVNSYVRFE